MKTKQNGDKEKNQPKERLLRSACQVFAEKGYHHATIPEICRRAGANVAAVNYYFSSKENLYIEVWRHAFDVAMGKHPIDGGVTADSTPEERMQAFVTGYVRRVFATDEAAWLPRLIVLELSNPTDCLEQLFELAIRPQGQTLRAIIKDLAGRDLPPAQLHACALSVVGQCMFYALSREARDRMTAREYFTPSEVEKVAAHITQFTLAGIRAVTAEEGGAA
jgi:AcrR family transcriptional regulator